MAKHLIVTCGTSQLEKLPVVADALPRGEVITTIDLALDDDDLPPPDYWKKRIQEQVVIVYANLFANKWEQRENWVLNRDNPFGAELSTLILMEHDGHWTPEEDTIHLISSETRPGETAAAVIALILQLAAGVPKNKIKILVAGGVRENTDSPDDAQRSLTGCITRDALQENTENCLLISGGFKSMLPAMTLTAFIFGLRMYYLYEDAERHQELNLVYNYSQDEVNRFWMETWQKMKNKNFASDHPLLQELLDKRLENSGVYYGGF